MTVKKSDSIIKEVLFLLVMFFTLPTISDGSDFLINRLSLDINGAKKLLPERDLFSNKGSFGKVLLICGSKNMVGCCYLATIGALRSGAGLVTLAFPDCLYFPLTSRLTENLFLPLSCNENGFISKENKALLIKAVNESEVVMLGCGIGVTDDTKSVVKDIILNSKTPLVLDADALNCIADSVEILSKAKCDILLTPHPGEMSRLCGKTVSEIQEDRESTAVEFCNKYKVNLLLKGHETIICNKECTDIYVNKTGNTGLSKGGAGDLLSGIISGLFPSMKKAGESLFSSAALGAFIHGLTSDFLKEEFSEYSMLPTDCADALPEVFSFLSNYIEV